MKVVIERDGVYEDDPVIAVYLDDGTEVGRYCIADDPRAEAAEMRKMLRAVAKEGFRGALEHAAAYYENLPPDDHSPAGVARKLRSMVPP